MHSGGNSKREETSEKELEPLPSHTLVASDSSVPSLTAWLRAPSTAATSTRTDTSQGNQNSNPKGHIGDQDQPHTALPLWDTQARARSTLLPPSPPSPTPLSPTPP